MLIGMVRSSGIRSSGHLHCETRHVTHSFGFGESKKHPQHPTILAREACEAEVTSWNILNLDSTLSVAKKMAAATMPTLQTPLTQLLGIQHPIMLAGMNGVSHSDLAAAVSNAGRCLL